MRNTFAGISRRYDLANHVLSGGLDYLWRRKAAALVAGHSPHRILDLACGSGDLHRSLQRANPRATVIGADFCLPMLEIARTKGIGPLVQADALALPFRDSAFDALTVAFGLRNMADWSCALREMSRVLRPGGCLLVMDFSMPPSRYPAILYRCYLHHVLPRIAGWLTGRPEAYDYLGESIEGFPRDQEMISLISKCGFHSASQIRLALGIASIYTASAADYKGESPP